MFVKTNSSIQVGSRSCENNSIRETKTMSSVKNFQLFSDATGEDTVLQFGRVGKEKFTMDVTYPLSPVQAFAIVLASMDKKMADSSLADGVKGIRKSWFGFGKKKAAGGKEGEEGEEGKDC